MQLHISMLVPPSTIIPDWVNETSQNMMQAYGSDRLCLGAHSTASLVEVSPALMQDRCEGEDWVER
jgi:hypothetical protein